MTDYNHLDWWIVSAGPKNANGDLLSITCEDLIVWDGFTPIFVATRTSTEIRDWFIAQGVDEFEELDRALHLQDPNSIFRIQPSVNIGVLARLTFPSGRV